jgi:hypothetical protein
MRAQAPAFSSAFVFALVFHLPSLFNPWCVIAFLLTLAHTAFHPLLVYLTIRGKA